ncbi:membrane protein [Actinorhabdospora filicis]|uniref:Membrane protein n=1 Tax=Actinorhabdospora filicis TaxID=1785913 RepID=A0A9W6W795_9ACTN|nr:glycosyltransferase family 87 protein [Actinorhabdospora filicis]GLZ75728.1 membrane protein [Actinorhabdospora filicis]
MSSPVRTEAHRETTLDTTTKAAPTGPRAFLRRKGTVTALRIALIVLLMAAVWILADKFGEHHRLFDFRIYRKAVLFWLDGDNILYNYSQPDKINFNLGFTYPPFAALIMIPLAILPYGLAKWMHLTLMSAALAFMCYWVATPLARRFKQPAWFVCGIAVPLAFALEPIRESLSFGQINHELAILIIGDLLFLVRRGSKWGGVGVGLATAIKLTPGIFIVYLLVTKRWRAAITSMFAAIIATVLAAGFDLRSSAKFWLTTFWDSGRVGILDQTSNTSINGILLRWFNERDPNYPKAVFVLGVVLVIGFGLWRAVRAHKAGDEICAMTIVGLVGVMVSPVSWIHHNFWIVPALVVLADVALRSGLWTKRFWAWTGMFLLIYLPFALTMSLRYSEVTTKHWLHGPWWWLGENSYVLLSVLLIVMLPIRAGTDEVDLARGNFWPRWPLWLARLPQRRAKAA